MEILQPITRSTQLGSETVRLHVSTLVNNNSELTVTAKYKEITFMQYFRQQDFRLKKGESLLFLKLLLSEAELNEKSIYLLSDRDVSLDNVVFGKEKVATSVSSYKIPISQGEPLKAVVLHIKYEEFQCLLQLPRIISKLKPSFEMMSIQIPQVTDAQQLSDRYFVQALEKEFMSGRL